MKLFGAPAAEAVLCRFLCVFSLLMLLSAVAISARFVRQKRYKGLLLSVPLIALTYFLEQCFDIFLKGIVYTEWAAEITNAFFSMPDLLLIGICLILAAGEVMMLVSVLRFEKTSISTMSVKEALDSLPTGILCYAPEARVLLTNRTMQDFCRKAIGTELTDGVGFVQALHKGALLPEHKKENIGGESVFRLADGSAWKLSEGEVLYEGHTVQTAFLSEITDVFRKTEELKRLEQKVEKLGSELQKVNREIVSLTSEREMLYAKVKIHDEFGSNLLSIRRFLTYGGTKQEKAELAETLRKNIAFLKNDTAPRVQDEYELLFSMASRLGLEMVVTGNLPQTERNKAIMATAIHECMTNTLRHAHGDRLCIEITEEAESITAVFTNNGSAPEGEIREKGGLASLRELTVQAGGAMAVSILPVFSVTINLPKEAQYGI